ncbi:hypothetical protein KFL_004230110 [Klebsormidium nitens]|uniref:Uncharacterized protein n=1 Tax=Klebsormidium nitens TaxID=105231 RepID=A0A1Y1IJR9_KLENI|nr:hypothetical protein KFL_004230110 [Klebsormidium nitens]|eukprot:GAQ88388.1 hypothetical protein KFL_004230110 [Klebsormidium nitens]
MAVEFSEVTHDAALLPSVTTGGPSLPTVQQAYFGSGVSMDVGPADGMTTPLKSKPPRAPSSQATRTPRRAFDQANPSAPSSPSIKVAQSPIRASPRQAYKERSRVFSSWTRVGPRRDGGSSTMSPTREKSGSEPVSLQNSFNALLKLETGEAEPVPEPEKRESAPPFTSVFVQNISRREIIYQLPLLKAETVSAFVGRVSTRFDLPEVRGRKVELRLQSHSLPISSLDASLETTSVRPGETVEFEAYLKCSRKSHLQPLSFFSMLKGGRLSKACIECDQSGKSGEVRERKGGTAPPPQGVPSGERWCAGCKTFNAEAEFGKKKNCKTCYLRSEKNNKARAEKKRAQKQGAPDQTAAEEVEFGVAQVPLAPGVVTPAVPEAETVPVMKDDAEGAPVVKSSRAGTVEMPVEVLTFASEEEFEAWKTKQETSGGIDLLSHRDQPSKLIDTGLPSFIAQDPTTWVVKSSVCIRSNATFRFREFKCMCHGKSKARSLRNQPKRGAVKVVAGTSKAVGGETAQDVFLRQAKEDEERGRRQARKGAEVLSLSGSLGRIYLRAEKPTPTERPG